MAGPAVLLCDDAQGLCLTLGTLLSDAGFDVSFASTWEDAVACATEQEPDAILVDLWMPTEVPPAAPDHYGSGVPAARARVRRAASRARAATSRSFAA